jgi:hypothetical protein
MPRPRAPQGCGGSGGDAGCGDGTVAVEPGERLSAGRQDHAGDDVPVERHRAQDVSSRLGVAERQGRGAVASDDVGEHAHLADDPVTGIRVIVRHEHDAREDQRGDRRDDADPGQLAGER